MVLDRVASNFVSDKKRNSENTPPKPKVASSKASSSSITAASRRRRARSNGMYEKLRAVESARRRNTRSPAVTLDVKPVATPSPAEDAMICDAPATTTSMPHMVVKLPRRLARPAFRDIEKATLAAIEPDLADTPIEYIRDTLRSQAHV